MSNQEILPNETSSNEEPKSLISASDWLKENDPDLFEFLERHCVRARMIQHLDNYALHALENM